MSKWPRNVGSPRIPRWNVLSFPCSCGSVGLHYRKANVCWFQLGRSVEDKGSSGRDDILYEVERGLSVVFI